MNGAVLRGEFDDSYDLHVPNYFNGTTSTDPIVYNKPVIHSHISGGYAGIFEDGTIGIWGTDGKSNDTKTLLTNINTTSWTVVDIVASTDPFVVLTSTGKLLDGEMQMRLHIFLQQVILKLFFQTRIICWVKNE